MEQPELHQCPCCKATKCMMDEPCLGCETYSQWLRGSDEIAMGPKELKLSDKPISNILREIASAKVKEHGEYLCTIEGVKTRITA